MSDIVLEQTMTVLYRAVYSRDEVIELLTEAGDDTQQLAEMTDPELGNLLAAAANSDDRKSWGLYERLTDDAGQWIDTTDVDDWKARVLQK